MIVNSDRLGSVPGSSQDPPPQGFIQSEGHLNHYLKIAVDSELKHLKNYWIVKLYLRHVHSSKDSECKLLNLLQRNKRFY